MGRATRWRAGRGASRRAHLLGGGDGLAAVRAGRRRASAMAAASRCAPTSPAGWARAALRDALEPLVASLEERAATGRRRRAARRGRCAAHARVAPRRATTRDRPAGAARAAARTPTPAGAAAGLDPSGLVVIVGRASSGPAAPPRRASTSRSTPRPRPPGRRARLALRPGALRRGGLPRALARRGHGEEVDEAELVGRYGAEVAARIGLRELEDDGGSTPPGRPC